MPATSLAGEINAILADTFIALGLPTEHATISAPNRNSSADFQCNGALPLAKELGRDAKHLAAEIAASLNASGIVSADVAGPGFLNLTVSQSAIDRHTTAAASGDLALHRVPTARVVIDFGGPNVAKPLHVGHLRSLVIGESLRRILITAGYDVVSDIHLGDWGLQMGQLISALELCRPTLPYFDNAYAGPYPETSPVSIADLEALYPAAAAACKADERRLAAARRATTELQQGRSGYVALWRHFRNVSLAAITTDIDALGAHFDLFNGESDANARIGSFVAELVAAGQAVKSQGATVVEVAQPSDGERPLPPLILEKSDGGAMYGTTDLVTIEQRVAEFSPAKIVYVVDQRQADHFDQVFRAARKIGIAADADLIHVGFGTVNGPDGRPLKTRAGGTVKLASLLEEATAKALAAIGDQIEGDERTALAASVANAALKFADLSSKRLTGYSFDMDQALAFTGKTGPYLQYATVRIASILEKSGSPNVAADWSSVSATERQLAIRILGFPEAFGRALETLEPSEIAIYAFDLAQAFSRFYQDCPVATEPNTGVRAMRVALCKATQETLNKALYLLGIEVPARM